MKVAQVPKPGADFEIVEREIPKPGAGRCASRCRPAAFATATCSRKKARGPAFSIPAFRDMKSRASSTKWAPAFRTWKTGPARRRRLARRPRRHVSSQCRRGDFRNCQNLKIPGISYDGGYQQYMVAPVEALVAIPDSLSDVEAAPLLCAGITTYNALRHSGALPGDLVAVQGIGGLGHLGIQFANKFGYKVAAIGRGSENAALAKKLGAHCLHRQQSDERRRRNCRNWAARR